MPTEWLAREWIQVNAAPEQLDAVHAALTRFWQHLSSTAPHHQARHPFNTAVAEIAANIIRYAFDEASREKFFHLDVRAYADRVQAELTDRGKPFKGSLAPRARQELDTMDLPESGMGLELVRALLDEFTYTRERDEINHWRLVKYVVRK